MNNQSTGRYFSQEELDAIVSGSVAPKMAPEIPQQQESKDTPWWDTADVLMSVPRGVVDYGKSIYNFADWVSADLLPDWHTNPLGTSQSYAGSFVSGIAQVAAGFLTASGMLRVGAAVPGAVGAASSWLGGAGGGTAGLVRAGLAKGAIADFLSFEAHDARLSDLLTKADNPVLNNVVTQYLASDMNDSELEGRLKNALEGGIVGVAFEGAVKMLKGSLKASKVYRASKAAGEAEEVAVKKAMDVAGDDLSEAKKIMDSAEEESLSKAPEAPAGQPKVPEGDAKAPTEDPAQIGGPNYGVAEARKIGLDENVAKEVQSVLAGGGSKDDIAAAIKRYDDAGVINFSRILRGEGTTEDVYTEAVAALRQFEANTGAFAKAPKGSNAATRDAAKATIVAIEDTGGANVAALKAMVQKGVMKAEEVYRLAPVFEGIELHLRSKMLQELRNPASANAEVMAQAWSSIAGSVERFYSWTGKALQTRQAFDTSANFMREIGKLTPDQRKLLANGMADTLRYLVLDPETGKEMAKSLTESYKMKAVKMVSEMHRNSILSGPKTLMVNFWSGVQMLLAPLERSAGRIGSGQADLAARELLTMSRYHSEALDALRAMKASFYEEGDSVMLGRGNTQYGEFAPQRAIGSRNSRSSFINTVDSATGGVNRTVAGAALDFFGKVVGMPSRLMGASDEAFMTLVARSESEVVLRRIIARNLNKPLMDVAVSSEVHRLKKALFVDGQLYSRKTVLERGMRMARDKYLPKALMETLQDSIAARKGLASTDPAVVSEATRMFGEMTDAGGKVKPLSEIRKLKDAEVMVPSLDAAGTRAIGDPTFIPDVQRFVDQNWDQYVDSDMMPAGGNFQEMPGQDFKILQEASKEVERRVREVTWKRDYEDMADSPIFLTRLVGNVGRSISGVVSHIPAMQMVVPFIRTPTNLLAYVTDRNPLSQSLAWLQAAKSGDKDAVAEAVGRLSTGTVLFGSATALAAGGLITGRGPKDPDMRKQLLAAGWQPYSFKFGDQWVSYGRNDPVATFFGLVADAYEVANSTYDPTPEDRGAMETALKATIASVSNNVISKSYLKGIVTALDALMGNEAAQGQLLRQYAGAVVPNVAAQAENYVLDPDIRETRTMWDAIRARTPFIGDSVDKVRDALGDPVKGSETALSMFFSGNARRISSDPVKREMADRLISVGSPRRTLPGGIDLKNITLKNGQSAYDRLQELTGQVRVNGKTVKQQLQTLISSPFYRGLPEMGQDNLDSPRVSLIRGHVSDYRKVAMQQLMRESPELAKAIANSRQVKASMYR